jgi:hypothetical protein
MTARRQAGASIGQCSFPLNFLRNRSLGDPISRKPDPPTSDTPDSKLALPEQQRSTSNPEEKLGFGTTRRPARPPKPKVRTLSTLPFCQIPAT